MSQQQRLAWVSSKSLLAFATNYASCDSVTSLMLYMYMAPGLNQDADDDTRHFNLARSYIITHINQSYNFFSKKPSQQDIEEIVMRARFSALVEMS